MKLYYAPGTCSLAPHIVLREAGLAFELEKVDLRTKQTESGADYRVINPKGYVPALKLDDGEVLTEGGAIELYLADLAPQAQLAPPAGTRERVRLTEWLVFIGTELHKSFSILWNRAMPDEAKQLMRERLDARFDIVESHLANGRQYLLGDRFSVADAYAFVVLNWSHHFKIELDRWPNLKAYLERIRARPSVDAAMRVEHPPR